MDCPPKKVALVERWPLVENSTVFRNRCLGERSSKKNRLMTYFSVSSLYSPILQEKSTICDKTCKETEKKLSCYLTDLSRIPVNKGTNSRVGWTAYSDLYETVHLSLETAHIPLPQPNILPQVRRKC